MKKVIATIVIAFAVTSAFAQQMQLEPKRSALNIDINARIDLVSKEDAKKYYSYLNEEMVVVKVTYPNIKTFKVFQATKEEYDFLKKEFDHTGLQVVLDGEQFVGFTKIIIY